VEAKAAIQSNATGGTPLGADSSIQKGPDQTPGSRQDVSRAALPRHEPPRSARAPRRLLRFCRRVPRGGRELRAGVFRRALPARELPTSPAVRRKRM